MSEKTAPLNVYKSLPKVELHRHLEGSLRLQTMLEVAEAHGITVPDNILRLSDMVQVQDEDPLTFQNFLAKFNTLRLFYRSPDVIHRVTREAVEDAARDNVMYMELRFTPVALSRAERFPLHDVMNWVCASASDAAEEFDIQVRLIASVNRHESPELAEQVAWLSAEHMKNGLIGMDLAGNEAEFKADPFYGIFREAKQAGLHVTIHAGEWGPAVNVKEAIEKFDAERVGHGVRVMEDENIVQLARERKTVFEVCVTSNYQSGVVPALADHPLPRMLNADLNVTINTDDPSVSRITLAHEYQHVCDDFNIPLDVLKGCVIAAAQASFIPEVERDALVTSLKQELKM